MMIVAPQPSETLSTHHLTRLPANLRLRCDALVVETLMSALGMRVGEILVDRMLQGAFPQYDHLLQRW